MYKNVDMQKIADEIDFDVADVEVIFEVFAEGLEESLLDLQKAIEGKDKEAIIRTAHSIKGSSLNLTFDAIATVARELELKTSKNESIDYNATFLHLKTLIAEILQKA